MAVWARARPARRLLEASGTARASLQTFVDSVRVSVLFRSEASVATLGLCRSAPGRPHEDLQRLTMGHTSPRTRDRLVGDKVVLSHVARRLTGAVGLQRFEWACVSRALAGRSSLPVVRSAWRDGDAPEDFGLTDGIASNYATTRPRIGH